MEVQSLTFCEFVSMSINLSIAEIDRATMKDSISAICNMVNSPNVWCPLASLTTREFGFGYDKKIVRRYEP